MQSTPEARIRREQRLARAKAARTQAPALITLTITADEVKVGDYVTTIPQQHGVRAMKCEAIVSAVSDDWETWKMGKMPVRSIRMTFPTFDTEVVVPEMFELGVRRPA